MCITSVRTVTSWRGESTLQIRIDAFSLLPTSIICSYPTPSEQFPSHNVGLMGEENPQFSQNWKTHLWRCSAVTKLSGDKAALRIKSGGNSSPHLPSCILLCNGSEIPSPPRALVLPPLPPPLMKNTNMQRSSSLKTQFTKDRFTKDPVH